jgi:hypothetical protein
MGGRKRTLTCGCSGRWSLSSQGHSLIEQRQLELVQARYESERARQQYQAVDPANRLVARELERRWNEALQGVSNLEEGLRAIVVKDGVSDEKRQTLLALGKDFACVWDNPATSQCRHFLLAAKGRRRLRILDRPRTKDCFVLTMEYTQRL